MDAMGVGITKDMLQDAVEEVKKQEHKRPLHIQTGLYGDTKNDWASAKEMLSRGNYLRGTIDAGIRTPIRAAVDTAKLPFSVAGRAMDPWLNTKHRNSSELEEFVNKLPEGEVSRDDRDTAMNALQELSTNLGHKRVDPSLAFTGLQNKFVRQKAQDVPQSTSPLSLVGDWAMFPADLASRLTGFNGESRDSYEKRMKDNNKTEKKASMNAYEQLMSKRASALGDLLGTTLHAPDEYTRQDPVIEDGGYGIPYVVDKVHGSKWNRSNNLYPAQLDQAYTLERAKLALQFSKAREAARERNEPFHAPGESVNSDRAMLSFDRAMEPDELMSVTGQGGARGLFPGLSKSPMYERLPQGAPGTPRSYPSAPVNAGNSVPASVTAAMGIAPSGTKEQESAYLNGLKGPNDNKRISELSDYDKIMRNYKPADDKNGQLQKKSSGLAEPEARDSLVGAGLGALAGGGIGYLTGEDGDEASGKKDTKLRNALIGALLGGGAGGGLGAWYGNAESYLGKKHNEKEQNKLADMIANG